MMSEINPYQSPEYGGAATELQPLGPVEGVWRQGDLLVVRKAAALPDRCVKTNEPACGVRFKKKYHWRPPLLYLAMFAVVGCPILLAIFFERAFAQDPPFLVILAGFGFLPLWLFARRAVLQMPVSPKWYAKRRRRIYTSWTLGAVAIGMFVVGVVWIALDWDPPALRRIGEVLAFCGGLGLLASGIVGSLAPEVPTVRRITKDYVWLKGVHPDYLAELPEWPDAV